MPGVRETMSKWTSTSTTALTVLSTPVLAGATLYLAISARDSAYSAREAAEAARETAVAVEAAVNVVRETADIARESVDVTRDWFELSQRPFISLGGWEIVARDSGRVVIRGRLSDVAGVPTAIENVCIWSRPQQVVESQRNFVRVNLDDNAIAFMDHHQWVLYGPLPLRTQVVGQRIGFLSTIYSFSREGTSSSETWRVDSEVQVAEESRLLIRTIDMYRVEEVTC